MFPGLRNFFSGRGGDAGEVSSAFMARAASGGIHGRPPSPPRGGRAFDRIRNLFNRGRTRPSVNSQSSTLTQNRIINQIEMASADQVLHLKRRTNDLYFLENDMNTPERTWDNYLNTQITKATRYSTKILENPDIFHEKEVHLAELMIDHTNNTLEFQKQLSSEFKHYKNGLLDIVTNNGSMNLKEYNNHLEFVEQAELNFIERLSKSRYNFQMLDGMLGARDSPILDSYIEAFKNIR